MSLDITIRTPAWAKQAACVGWNPELWYPKFAGNREEKVAKAVCNRRCPVREQCLADALEQGRNAWGIWGGMNEDERRALRGAKGRRA